MELAIISSEIELELIVFFLKCGIHPLQGTVSDEMT